MAISLVGFSGRITGQKLRLLAQALRDSATALSQAISRSLGFKP